MLFPEKGVIVGYPPIYGILEEQKIKRPEDAGITGN